MLGPRPKAHLSSLATWLVCLGALGAGSCGKSGVADPARTVSGSVLLVGHLTNDAGRSLGTRVTADASGIRVDLLSGDRVVDSTLTAQGRYRFQQVPDGSYQLRARIVEGFEYRSAPIQMASAPIEVRDTLRLASVGDLLPIPNPFADTLTVTFRLPTIIDASLRVVDQTGHERRMLIAGQFQPGLQRIDWNGRDRNGEPLAPGEYWLLFQGGGQTRAQLLLRR